MNTDPAPSPLAKKTPQKPHKKTKQAIQNSPKKDIRGKKYIYADKCGKKAKQQMKNNINSELVCMVSLV